eukprot:scaffold92999_cov21-Tisochrysis_lutea.AAC.1
MQSAHDSCDIHVVINKSKECSGFQKCPNEDDHHWSLNAAHRLQKVNKKRNAEVDDLRAQLASLSSRLATSEASAQKQASAAEAQVADLEERNRCAAPLLYDVLRENPHVLCLMTCHERPSIDRPPAAWSDTSLRTLDVAPKKYVYIFSANESLGIGAA